MVEEQAQGSLLLLIMQTLDQYQYLNHLQVTNIHHTKQCKN